MCFFHSGLLKFNDNWSFFLCREWYNEVFDLPYSLVRFLAGAPQKK